MSKKTTITDQGGVIRFAIPKSKKRKIKKRSSQADEGSDLDAYLYIDPEYDPDSLIQIYEKNSTAHKCIDLTATNTVINGWNITSSKTEGDSVDPDVERAKEFFHNCNPEGTLEDVIIAMVTDRQTTGSAAIEVARNRATKLPEHLYHMPISRMRVAKGVEKVFRTGQRFVELKSDAEIIRMWYNRYYSNPKDRTAENGYDPEKNKAAGITNEVIWFKMPNPKSRWYGTAPSVSLLKMYLIAMYAEDFNVNEFENGMLNKFAITVENGKLTNASIQGLRAYMEELLSSKQWSSVPVLQATGQNAKVKIERLSPDIKESSFLETLKFVRQNVHVAFGVPPILLGITENSTLANQSAQEKKFYDSEIKPLQNQISRIFTRMLREDFGYKSLTFTFNVPSFEDEQKRAELELKQKDGGVISINEIRSNAGLDTTDGGDRPFIMTTFGPIFIDELEDMGGTEEAVEKMLIRSSEKMMDHFLDYRKALQQRVVKQLIESGKDGGESEPYMEAA